MLRIATARPELVYQAKLCNPLHLRHLPPCFFVSRPDIDLLHNHLARSSCSPSVLLFGALRASKSGILPGVAVFGGNLSDGSPIFISLEIA